MTIPTLCFSSKNVVQKYSWVTDMHTINRHKHDTYQYNIMKNDYFVTKLLTFGLVLTYYSFMTLYNITGWTVLELHIPLEVAILSSANNRLPCTAAELSLTNPGQLFSNSWSIIQTNAGQLFSNRLGTILINPGQLFSNYWWTIPINLGQLFSDFNSFF